MGNLKYTYVKPQDLKEIKMSDGRLVRVFTLLQHNSIWMTCIYDEVRDIAWQMPHMDYQAAYSDYVTFCKLLK